VGIGLFYLFSKLEFLGRNDGIQGNSAASRSARSG